MGLDEEVDGKDCNTQNEGNIFLIIKSSNKPKRCTRTSISFISMSFCSSFKKKQIKVSEHPREITHLKSAERLNDIVLVKWNKTSLRVCQTGIHSMKLFLYIVPIDFFYIVIFVTRSKLIFCQHFMKKKLFKVLGTIWDEKVLF